MHTSRRRGIRTTAARTAARCVGAAFLLLGVLGFVPGATTSFDSLGFAGPASQAQLFGIFQVSVLVNIVHLVAGIIGLLAARRVPAAVSYLVVGGLVYLLLWAYGGMVGENTQANVMPLDRADDWLHLGIGLVMLALGLLPRQRQE